MAQFQTIGFDDFPSDQPVGQEVDTLAAQFGLMRNVSETDMALLTRAEIKAGFLYGVEGPVYGGVPNVLWFFTPSLVPASPVFVAPSIWSLTASSFVPAAPVFVKPALS